MENTEFSQNKTEFENVFHRALKIKFMLKFSLKVSWFELIRQAFWLIFLIILLKQSLEKTKRDPEK